VINVSRDAVSDPASETGQPASQATPPRVPSPAYVARISLNHTDMMVDGRRQPLMPGMAVTAEIKTGERTVIDYLLSPIARRAQESLHER
jgi:hemolysin D